MRLVPGFALCVGIALTASLADALGRSLSGGLSLDALVLAILIAAAFRVVYEPGARLLPGIDFSARILLEVAVALLGLSISLQRIAEAGVGLPATIVGVVLVSIIASYVICRFLGIGRHMAALIACGNAICGNSAIAAVAPAIRASREDVVSAITFSAVLSVVVVVYLPLLIPLFDLADREYGILAGLTIYAVPQVLAATAPAGLQAVQIGTTVKLIRVLMLGPVVVAMSALAARHRATPTDDAVPSGWREALVFTRMVPPFILVFLLLATLSTIGLIPAKIAAGAVALHKALALVAMAGLGLSVDARLLFQISGRLTLAVTASLLVLVAASLAAIRFESF
ncbi:YeiH family protein [Chelativorans xinjiangense]|uniref:YeiH family protein n=1 Tax=Chelativorans xinjiangense TaxID=2681485 RepID=UPI001FEB1ADE|nr:putative sulfate exporter family transporter [Chelativorans xinjiangense]